MSNDETPQERQENEIEALKSIFGGDVKDLRSGPSRGSAWAPMDLCISLHPLQGSSVGFQAHARISLHVKCSRKYPDIVPELSLECGRGLSDAQIAELGKQLDQLAKKKRGEVMVFELAQHVQAFLHKHNAPPPVSFYDEMLNQRRQRDEMKLQEDKMRQDQQMQDLREEVMRRKEMLKTEQRLRRESRLSLSESMPSITTQSSESSGEFPSAGISPLTNECQQHRSTKVVVFPNNRRIQRGRCLGHSESGFITFIGLDFITGEPQCLKEYKIHCSQPDKKQKIPNQQSKYMINANGMINHIDEMLSTLEKQLARLVEIKHSNLVTYENYFCSRDDNMIIVCLLQQFIFVKSVVGGSRQLARSCLRALAHLHRNGIWHGNLVETSVLIDNTGHVRLTDFGFQLITGAVEDQGGSLGPQRDLQSLGELLKKGATSEHDPQLWDLIDKCLSADGNTYAEGLLLHPFFTSQEPVAIPVYNVPIHPAAENFTEHQRNGHDPGHIGGRSRILSEFTVLQELGKGAYGDVLKVRNKLDNGEYAIKRIPLNPRNRQLYRKITREVELLSRLNHENVVRYYNSWIETAIVENTDSPTEMSADVISPPETPAEWSISHEAGGLKTKAPRLPSESDSDDDFITFLPVKGDSSSSDGIYFEGSGEPHGDTESSADAPNSVQEAPPRRELQYMYIQMEFCEKSTLRTAIDSGLHKDTERVWRLFREIVEGLSHIHQQGMIHRDLKPVNIFLDSRDQVKIGDFGLATTSVMARNDGIRTSLFKENENATSDIGTSLTGHVGTTLYVAPELCQSGSKLYYNQKVDLYSLGIILFEMSYALSTGMERVKVLTALRTKEVIMPDNMIAKYPKQAHVIKWLLNHDASQRPTSSDLLTSDAVPPVRLEDRELTEMIRTTLANPKAKAYKHLVARCLGQHPDSALDITYHMEVGLGRQSLFEIIKETCIQVFRKHGASEMLTPLLTPLSKTFDTHETCVRLMTHSGSVVTLPHDLRVPFARHAALSDIKNIRRFAIERVYSEKKIFGFHPREMYECAFDIITPTSGNLLIDAELISVVFEIIRVFPELKHKNIKIKLNHTALLNATLVYCGVSSDKQVQLFSFLDDFREEKISKFQLHMYLTSLGQGSGTLLDLLESDTPLDGSRNSGGALQTLSRARGEAGKQARMAIRELETVAHFAKLMGVEYSMSIRPGLRLVGSRRVVLSGVMFQVICDREGRKRAGPLVMAAGGRYDSMLAEFRKRFPSCKGCDPGAVGLSVSLDRLVQTLSGSEPPTDLSRSLDVAVCSGDPSTYKEVTAILRSLWLAGLHTCVVEVSSGSSEEALEQARELGAPHVILPSENNSVRVRSWNHERFQERKVQTSELIEYIQRLVKTGPDLFNESTTLANSSSGPNIPAIGGSPVLPQLSIRFVTTEKLTANQRRRYENQMIKHMTASLQRLGAREKVFVLGLELTGPVLRHLGGALEPYGQPQSVDTALREVSEKYPRYKKYLMKIGDELIEAITDRDPPIIALYSIVDSAHRIVL